MLRPVRTAVAQPAMTIQAEAPQSRSDGGDDRDHDRTDVCQARRPVLRGEAVAERSVRGTDISVSTCHRSP
jgi:hypothetical protein